MAQKTQIAGVRGQGSAAQTFAAARRKARSERLENSFALLWQAADGRRLKREYRFDDSRRWRFDFAEMLGQTAIEIEGGGWSGGRHVRGKGFEADAEKYLAAAVQGWVVVRLTAKLLTLANVRAVAKLVEWRQFQADHPRRLEGRD